ncbi:hypothetical protein FCM35_KLT19799 [Carex littledalei]|uniref:Uncharacterized protein n=1 Tax=Carex littledalei TaxID=544730 RepID=A0A833VDJ6_9POAL|nr:hypothetical protein FCM35_KLT19799 [Carex littledalei]
MGDFKTQVNGRTQDLKALFKKAIKAVGPPCKKGAKVVGSGYCVVDYPLYVICLAFSPLSFLSDFLRALPDFSWDFL